MEEFAGFEGLEALEIEWAFSTAEERYQMVADGRCPLSVRERIEDLGAAMVRRDAAERLMRAYDHLSLAYDMFARAREPFDER
jgi:hypothetical protein